MSQSNKEYTLYDVYLAIQDEIDHISYIEKDQQINAIIYCINYICDYNIDLDYPPIEQYESEMSYLREMFETQTMVMIEAAIEEFNKFIV